MFKTGAPEGAVREFDRSLEKLDLDLFEEWDRIAGKYNLNSQEMLALVHERVDTEEAYREWIEEGWDR